jgi:hypothetical protein
LAWEKALMGSEGRKALGYDHGYDGEVFYLGLALDPAYFASTPPTLKGLLRAAW